MSVARIIDPPRPCWLAVWWQPVFGTGRICRQEEAYDCDMTKLKELIGIIKDKASQGKAAILSKHTTLSLLRATSHDSFTPPSYRHISLLLSSGDGSRATASAVIELLMDRLQSTQNSAVALKCLIGVHHIIKHGTFILQDQLSVYPSTGGRNYLNLSNFRDKSSPISWELSSWIRWYAQHIEQLLCTSRVLGFFVGACSSGTTTIQESQEERVSGITNADLLRETDSLVALVEGIGKRPNPASANGNKLLNEITRLVVEDSIAALSEVWVRVNEFRERLGHLNFGEAVELVCAIKRLEGCKEKMAAMEVAPALSFWVLVAELREKAGKQVYREEGKLYKTVTRHAPSASDRFAGRALKSAADLVRFPSGRLL